MNYFKLFCKSYLVLFLTFILGTPILCCTTTDLGIFGVVFLEAHVLARSWLNNERNQLQVTRWQQKSHDNKNLTKENDHFKQIGLIAANGFMMMRIIFLQLNSVWYVAKLWKIGRLGQAFAKCRRKFFYLINLAIVYVEIFRVHIKISKKLSWKYTTTISWSLNSKYSAYFWNHNAKMFATTWLLISLFTME